MPIDSIGGWVQVHDENFNGHKLHTLNPKPGEIRLLSAARATSYLCRYSGNLCTGTRRPWHKLRPGPHKNNVAGPRIYSVAQHSVILSYLVSDAHRIWALFHDLTEGCGMVDIPWPVKAFLPQIREIENNIWMAMVRDFGFPPHLPQEVEYWDKRIVSTERRDLLGPNDTLWGNADYEPLPLRILPMNPMAAYGAWLKRYQELTAPIQSRPSNARMVYNRARFLAGLRYTFTGVDLAGLADFERQRDEALREISCVLES